MKRVLIFAALAILASCVEPPDPHFSHLDRPVIITLKDGSRVECPTAKEAARGWECWPSIDAKRQGPLRWFDKGTVVSVEANSGLPGDDEDKS